MLLEELNISNAGFESDISNFLSKRDSADKEVISSVSEIIKDVSLRGEEALVEITKIILKQMRYEMN